MQRANKNSKRDWREIFDENTRQIELVPDCAELWVLRAILLMLDEHPDGHTLDPLKDVEKCILKALDLNPNHLEALEEAAHFYDCVAPDRRKAIRYARRCAKVAGKTHGDMQAIIEDSD